MKLLMIRHAEPDYSIDSLTPKGWREAEYLSDRLCKLDVKAFYVSTMGRAKDTARATLQKLNRTAIECDWLREFGGAKVTRADGKTIIWDWLPAEWTAEPDFYAHDRWFDAPQMRGGGVREAYERVAGALDGVLAEHGYVRDGMIYRAERPSNDTIVLFCHFGVECVLLSHLLGISPMPLWHGLCALPSSVTTLVTEERREGIAYFRACGFGDISHLYARGEEPSFAARFCECFTNEDERHD